MKNLTITHYKFDNELEKKIVNNHRDYLSWPLVYFLNDSTSKDAYVGETTDVLNRMRTHSKTEKKKSLSAVNLILSDYFNKSATLDLEANLIRYISADGQFTLQNGNLGIANHQYYQQKEVYWGLFNDIWDELRAMGIARHSLDHINNSDLFKYSPYKSLSKEQINSLKLILNCLLDENAKVSLIHGGAGTGKSILAIFLFKLLKTDLENFNYSDFDTEDEELFNLLKEVKDRYGDLKMALVIPMGSFRKTISKVFKNIQGLSSNMVIGPSDLSKQKFDLIIVDEGHRLRRRVNLGPYFKPFDDTCNLLGLDKLKASELDWLLIQSNKSLIFYDQFQSIKPSDTLRENFIALEKEPSTRIEILKTQFRCKGGNEYVQFIHSLFSDNQKLKNKFESIEYECFLFENIQEMVDEINKKESIHGLSRIVAGYAWEWKSNKNKDAFDIEIESTKLRWNSVAVDWVNSKNSINEVGCIHTTQGYDLNYTGVIIGPEIDYDFENHQFIIYKDRYKDKAGKNTVSDEIVLKNFILNIYRTILLRGIKGTYIYACNENLRKYLSQFISAKYTKQSSFELKILDEANEFTIPYYDLEIAAGEFSDLQTTKKVKYIVLENKISNTENLFACRIKGESMNKIIPNNSICLFEKYSGGSRNGLITLVEMSDYTDLDFGSSYTLKEYSSKKTVSEDGWQHQEIILHPKSTLPYEPIILRDEETINLKVIGVFIRIIQ
jgi:DUF2075 family protein/predicted GIY-YIG superfamily endonuclease